MGRRAHLRLALGPFVRSLALAAALCAVGRRGRDRPGAAARARADGAARRSEPHGGPRRRSPQRHRRLLAQRDALAGARLDGEARGRLRRAGGLRRRPSLPDRGRRRRRAGRARSGAGNLVLRGYGDPTLGQADLDALAADLAALGIRRVTGSVVGDESWFDPVRTAPGWLPRFYIEESPPLSALVVERALYRGRTSRSPALAAASLFRAALEANGIRVVGRSRVGVPPPGAPLARDVSPPLATIVRWMGRESDNFVAELLVKHLGALDGVQGTTAARHARRAGDAGGGGRAARRGSPRRRLGALAAQPHHRRRRRRAAGGGTGATRTSATPSSPRSPSPASTGRSSTGSSGGRRAAG